MLGDCFKTGTAIRLYSLIFFCIPASYFKSAHEFFIICNFQEIESCDGGNSKTGFEELKRSLNALDLSEQLDIGLEKVAYDMVSRLDDVLLSNVKVCTLSESLSLVRVVPYCSQVS